MAATVPSTTLPDAPAYMLPGVELFASGVYRQKKWGTSLIREMAENAPKLGPSGLNIFVPPAVLGHEEKQEWLERTDLPAAGQVDPDTVRAVPDEDKPGEMKLIGDLVNIPREVAERIVNREFSRVSAEIYDRFLDDHGKAYGKVLRRLALLGAEPPQVKRLKPLGIPQPMQSIRQFAERRAGVLIRLRHDAGHCFAEAIAVDRNQLTAAAKAALPSLSSAFLDALTDDKLAELVKSVPTPEQPQPQAAPMMPPGMQAPGMMSPPAQPVAPPIPPDPSMEFADMTRDEMIAKLVEAGEGTAEELAALSDDELQAMLDAPPEGGDGGGVEEMGDPATMSREEMIAELAAGGQDPTALEAMPDEELRALYAQVTGAATAAAPAAAAPPVTPMSESKKLLKNLRKLNTFAEREGRRLKAASAQNKRRDAEQFCEKLVADGKVTPAQKDAFVLPLLLLLDDNTPAHKFSENGVTRKVSAYSLKKTQLAKLAPVVRFGERLGGSAPDGGAEVQKVERFAEQTFPDAKVRQKYVGDFKALQAKKPELTAREYGVNPVHA